MLNGVDGVHCQTPSSPTGAEHTTVALALIVTTVPELAVPLNVGVPVDSVWPSLIEVTTGAVRLSGVLVNAKVSGDPEICVPPTNACTCTVSTLWSVTATMVVPCTSVTRITL